MGFFMTEVFEYPMENLKNITVVGSGILGLSVAEYFSRETFENKYQVSLSTKSLSHNASHAAAANLATMGQLYARDPHFQLKLEGKAQYSKWLTDLISEVDRNPNEIQNHFHCGYGIDIFFTEQERQKKLKRVLQSSEQLTKRGFPQDKIQCSDSAIKYKSENLFPIFYKNEAWVRSEWLLGLLKDVLDKRQVPLKIQDSDEIHAHSNNHIISCMGSDVTKIPAISGLKHKKTVGTTYFCDAHTSQKIYEKLNNLGHQIQSQADQCALWTFHIPNHNETQTKVTVSGNGQRMFFSSTTFPAEEDPLQIFMQEQKFQEKLKKFFLDQFQLNLELQGISGTRIRFGHSEWILKDIADKASVKRHIVCGGAHKSGFLIAPVIGEKIEAFFQ